jgi:hypothetical protein
MASQHIRASRGITAETRLETEQANFCEHDKEQITDDFINEVADSEQIMYALKYVVISLHEAHVQADMR